MLTFANQVERFERSVVFRYARVLPIVLAALATVTGVGAILMVTYSLIPPTRAKVTPAGPPPPAVTVSREDVLAYLKAVDVPDSAIASPPPPSTVAAAGSTTNSGPSAEAITLAKKLHQLRGVAASRDLPWTDESTQVCTSGYMDQCYSYDTRIVAKGVGPAVLGVLKQYDNTDVREEVQIDGSDQSYVVNASNVEIKLALLSEITSILQTSPRGNRSLASAWAQLRHDKENARQQAIDAESMRVNAETVENEIKYAAAQAKRVVVRWTSTRALLGALAGLVGTGLLLAVLAIERNTRAVERLVNAQLAAGKV
jgi:hypothetical protein